MASSWLTSWLSSWGNSWGTTDTPAPAQTGGAGYWSTREIRRKKRRNTLQRDIENTYEQLQKVQKAIEVAPEITEAAPIVQRETIEAVKPDFTPLVMQARELQFRLDRLKALVQFLDRQQQDDEAMILLMSLPFLRLQ
jgi:hypothetical protein